jgi:GNAT superfamily N-acetyltransferase
MFTSLLINFHQFKELFNNSGFRQAFRKAYYVDKEAVPVKKELADAPPLGIPPGNPDYRFIEVTQEAIAGGACHYRVKSRLLKTKTNMKHGFRAFAVVNGDTIIGDIWCAGRKTSRHARLHKDVDLLFLTPGPNDVYMFDMFIDPSERGKNIAVFLMGSSLDRLRELGFANAFGYFEARNIPALWVHRTLKFTELNRVLFSRLFFFRTSRPASRPVPR